MSRSSCELARGRGGCDTRFPKRTARGLDSDGDVLVTVFDSSEKLEATGTSTGTRLDDVKLPANDEYALVPRGEISSELGDTGVGARSGEFGAWVEWVETSEGVGGKWT